MKTKISRILGVGLALIMVLTMAGAFLPAKVEAAPLPAISGNVWSQFAFPQAGAAGGFFRDAGIATVGPFAKAINGDLYAFVTFAGAPVNRLLKSTNGGRSWTQLANYNTAWGVVLDIATSTNDANTVYFLCAANLIERTLDGGATYAQITAPVGAATLGSIATGYYGGRNYIFVGDTTIGAETAWYLDDSVYGAPWNGMLIGAGSAVWEISTSPNFSTEASPLVLAVVWPAAPHYRLGPSTAQRLGTRLRALPYRLRLVLLYQTQSPALPTSPTLTPAQPVPHLSTGSASVPAVLTAGYGGCYTPLPLRQMLPSTTEQWT